MRKYEGGKKIEIVYEKEYTIGKNIENLYIYTFLGGEANLFSFSTTSTMSEPLKTNIPFFELMKRNQFYWLINFCKVIKTK
jgi:hypothetical protein